MNRLDEICMEMIDRASADQRFANLNDRYVKDSIGKLKLHLEKRTLQLIKQKEDPDRLSKIREILERLKKKGL